MKVALVTDTHFGARSDSIAFDAYFAKFYDETFFPYLKEHDIKTVCHLAELARLCHRVLYDSQILLH